MNKLCLQCGMCCDGSIFANVRLQAADDPRRLSQQGLALTAPVRTRFAAFTQPCAMLEGCRCRIYDDRPQHCRKFNCALLQKVAAGSIPFSGALSVVQQARRKTDLVLTLLRRLGNTDEHKPIAARVRHTSARLAEIELDRATARLYGDLTLAAHDLNCLLNDSFYPGWQ